jgi:RES domain-containing protein
VISLFRLSSARFPSNSGAGAAKFGGRWNPVGTEVIYAAKSAALAALEILVHFSALPKGFVLTEIQVPENIAMLRWEVDALPAGWNSEIVSHATQALGAAWVRSRRSALLSVSSSIIPTDRNFVINPAHPAFKRIKFLPAVPFAFDPRLK